MGCTDYPFDGREEEARKAAPDPALVEAAREHPAMQLLMALLGMGRYDGRADEWKLKREAERLAKGAIRPERAGGEATMKWLRRWWLKREAKRFGICFKHREMLALDRITPRGVPVYYPCPACREESQESYERMRQRQVEDGKKWRAEFDSERRRVAALVEKMARER
jgi:hypothetical protein